MLYKSVVILGLHSFVIPYYVSDLPPEHMMIPLWLLLYNMTSWQYFLYSDGRQLRVRYLMHLPVLGKTLLMWKSKTWFFWDNTTCNKYSKTFDKWLFSEVWHCQLYVTCVFFLALQKSNIWFNPFSYSSAIILQNKIEQKRKISSDLLIN